MKKIIKECLTFSEILQRQRQRWQASIFLHAGRCSGKSGAICDFFDDRFKLPIYYIVNDRGVKSIKSAKPKRKLKRREVLK